MIPSDLKNSFILKNFYQFFEQIIFEKKTALSGISSSSQNEELHQQALYDFVANISKNLSTLLEAQSFNVSHEGGDFLVNYYQEALYIMAVLADEIFLNLDWVGKNIWDMFLVEQKLFKTQIAGDKFFENLETYLLDRDPLKIDLGALYYLALALGFRGKYRGIDDKGIIKDYMHSLFLFVVRKEPDFQSQDYLLFPETYGYTQDQGLIINLPNPRIWYAAFIGLIFGMGILGSIFWYVSTNQFNSTLNEILHHRKQIERT